MNDFRFNENGQNEEFVGRYVDLLTNSGFKAVFGDRDNKDVVMSVINALLHPHRHVTDIEYAPTEYQGRLIKNKEFRYDFMCKGTDGVAFIVEVQCYPEAYWFQRCVSYASRAYDRQNVRGGGYDVPPVYLIGLMGTDIPHREPDKWDDRFVSEYTFREKFTGELLDETIIITFAELARFGKRCEDCRTDTDKMMYILKNMGNLRNRPLWLQREIYTKIFEACEIARFNEEKLIKYEKDMYDERRLYGELEAARDEGMEKGREEGKLDAARKMLAAGIDAKVIADALDIPVEDILSI